MNSEADPNGMSAHEPGAKLDAGKVRPELILDGMGLAILAVAEVGTIGAIKYTDDGWKKVPNGIVRYAGAKDRHRLKGSFEMVDGDTGLLHAAHEAWNALAKLQLMVEAAILKGVDTEKVFQVAYAAAVKKHGSSK